MTDAAPFLAMLKKDPTDWATRLVYADWLDERGHAAEAYLQRLAVQCKQVPEDYGVLHVRAVGLALVRNIDIRPDRNDIRDESSFRESYFRESQRQTMVCEALIYNLPELRAVLRIEQHAEIGALGSSLGKDWLIIDPPASVPRFRHGFFGVLNHGTQGARPWSFGMLEIAVFPKYDAASNQVRIFTRSLLPATD